MLFRAHVVEDDAELSKPHLITEWGDHLANAANIASAFFGIEVGCGGIIAIFFVVITVILLSLVVIEVLIPGVAFALYWLTRGMLAQVTNSHRRCEGKFIKSLAWGALWATVYNAPLALAVWGIHGLLVIRGR